MSKTPRGDRSSPPGPLHLRRPSPETAAAFRAARERGRLSYEAVGATRETAPPGWPTARERISLGRGEGVWEQAVAALRRGAMFDLPWTVLHPPFELVPDAILVFSSRQLGVWMISACRVVYVDGDPSDTGTSFSFAWGTLRGHAVAGEERFALSRSAVGDEVWLETSKFSRLAHPLVMLVGPYARYMQRRFSREALAEVRRAVEAAR